MPKGSLLGADAVIDIGESGVITDIIVSVDIEHPDLRNLELILLT